MKPVIGITAHIMSDLSSLSHEPFGHSHIGNTYVIAVSKSGGIPVIIPSSLNDEERAKMVEICDGFLFSGGVDISPSFYNEDAHLNLMRTNIAFDRTQIGLMKDVLRAGKPVLGICRGHQVMNVACGGSLYQDTSEIPGCYIKHSHETGNADIAHKVIIKEDSILHKLFGDQLQVNSYHHQSLKALGENVIAVAHAADGVVEAIELKDYPFALGVQWHPEAMYAIGDDSMKPIFDVFVEACSKCK